LYNAGIEPRQLLVIIKLLWGTLISWYHPANAYSKVLIGIAFIVFAHQGKIVIAQAFG
jgi:hypothetical protein